MVEFKQDNRDGSLRLMEINARFWGSLQLAIDAGVNFPCILADIAAGRSPTGPSNIVSAFARAGLPATVDALIMLLTRSRRSLALPPSHPGRLVTLARFLRLWDRDLHYEIERLDDPKPMRLEWRRRLLGG